MSLKYRSALLLILFSLTYTYTSAQNKYSALQQQIDSLITQDLPKSALEKVHELKALAVADKNDIQRLNAILYELNLTAQTEKNLEKNIEVLNRETENAAFPLKAILQSVLAETYWNYYKQNRYKISNRNSIEKEGDFRNWDFRTITRKISKLYDASLSSKEILQNIPINEYTTVLKDSINQNLRPSLYDLLAHRALAFYNSQESHLNVFNTRKTISEDVLFDNNYIFYNSKEVVFSETDSLLKKTIGIYQNLYQFHHKKNHADALADLYLNRLINIPSYYIGFKNRDSLLLKALSDIEKKYPSSAAIADVLYEKALIYERKQQESTGYAIYQNIIEKFPESNASENAKVRLFRLEKKELNIRLEANNIPGKNILATIDFKNVSQAKYTIYKLNEDDLEKIIPLTQGRNPDRETALEYLKKKKDYKVVNLDLPKQYNFKQNTTEIRIEPLPVGVYFLVLEYEDIKKEDIKLAYFNISNMAALSKAENGKQKIRVADRTTGSPLKDVSVIVYKHESSSNSTSKEILAKGKTDNNGFFITQKDKYHSYKLRLKNDVLYNSAIYFLFENNSVTGKEETETSLFIDREIYRPGQTIYFKGIKYINSAENPKVCEGYEVEITFRNSLSVFEKVKLKTNEFGTFSGSFEIPESLLSGMYYIRIGNQRHSFKIEEYKRPAFFIQFSPATEKLTQKDSIKITGTAKSYAGYNVQGAKVTYTVFKNRGYYTGQREIYYTASTKTDKQGSFSISFMPQATDEIFTYSITADVTDISGETQQGSTSATVGNPSVRLTASVLDENYVTDTLKIPFSLTDLNRNNINGKIKVSIYNFYPASGQYYLQNMVPTLTDEEYERYFPELDRHRKNTKISANRSPLFEKEFIINTKNSEQILNITGLESLPADSYIISFTAYNETGDSIVSSGRRIKLITPKIGVPLSGTDWLIHHTEYVNKGENAVFYTGFNKACAILMEVYENHTLKYFNWIKTTGSSYEKVLVPYNGETDLEVVLSTMFNNRFYKQTEQIKPFKSSGDLKIEMISFREKVKPGDRDKWRIKVTDKNNLPVQTELLASMYDASLDAISRNSKSWKLNANYRDSYLSPWIPIQLSGSGGYGIPIKYLTYNYHYIKKEYSKLKYLDYNYSGLLSRIAGTVPNETDITIRGNNSLYGEGPANTLNEVAVVGYGTTSKADITGAVAGVTITETGDNNEIFTNVDNADNTETSISQQIRKNFGETAFFYPHIVTDEKGEAEFEFTFPESLTTWNFRLLGHTKDLKTAYIAKKIIAQKPLMITANMPRFLREGDHISLVTKITNLTAREISGESKLQLFYTHNRKPLQAFTFPFKTGGNASATNNHSIKIPEGLAGITYRAIAENNVYYDGEEKNIPVLSQRISLSESNSFILKPGEQRNIKLEDFIGLDDKQTFQSMVFNVKTNPLWDVINALPYLQKECKKTESTNNIFNTFFINQMAVNIRKDYGWMVYSYYSTKKDSSKTKSPFLGNNPWFAESDIYKQEENLKKLFKGYNTYTEQSMAINRLQKMQRADGSFPWFENCNYEDRYITQNIIAGFGQLQKISTGSFLSKQKEQLIKKALTYLDNQLVKVKKTSASIDVHGWYARSFHQVPSERADFETAKATYLDFIHKNWQKYTEYEQGLIAYTFINFNQNEQALPILKSLKEKALFTKENSAYWAKEQNFYLWNRAEIEKHALMVNLFNQLDDEKDFAEQLKNWLILNKQATHWKTSNATSAACFAILTNGRYKIDSKGLKIFSGGKSNPENRTFKSGNYQYLVPVTDNKPDFPFYKIENASDNMMTVSLSYSYQQDLEKVKPHSNGLTLQKKYYKKDEKGILKEINHTNVLKVGDKITARLYINADQDFEYIYLKDERPSGTEPVSLVSSYKYLENLFYYITTKDTSTDIYFNYIPKGSYVIDYDLYSAQGGQFSSGISRIESLYAPEFGAHTTNYTVSIND